jgi:hypothetical protein
LIEPTPASRAVRGQVEQIWTHLENATVNGPDADTRRNLLHDLQILEANLTHAAASPPQ